MYKLSADNEKELNGVNKHVKDSNFFFDAGSDMPSMEMTMPSKECVDRFITEGKDEFDDLIHIFSVLKKYNMHFGYRVMNEIARYMCNVYDTTSYPNKSIIALDNQILQKILPKFYGSYDKLWGPLIEILSLCTISGTRWKKDIDSELLISELNSISGGLITDFEINADTVVKVFKYPKAAMKIIEMMSDLNTTGFATFIK